MSSRVESQADTVRGTAPAACPDATDGGTPDFDWLAPLYRWMEMATFGPWLHRCRWSFPAELERRRKALIFGDGDGRFTARLLERNAAVHVEAVDASAAMLRSFLRRAAPHAGRVRTEQADARSWQAHRGEEFGGQTGYDLVATHFFLDCLTTAEVYALASRVRLQMAADASWVVSEFAVPAGGFGRFVAGPLVSALYLAFGWMTGLTIRKLPDHEWALERAGFICTQRRKWLGGLLVSEIWKPLPG